MNSHFTKEAAEAFIQRKMQDYRKGMWAYVEAQVYCWEFNVIIAGVMDGRIVFKDTDERPTNLVSKEKHDGRS